jgi:hypothetical protein
MRQSHQKKVVPDTNKKRQATNQLVIHTQASRLNTSQATLIPSLMLMLMFLIYVVELSRRNFQPILARLSSQMH